MRHDCRHDHRAVDVESRRARRKGSADVDMRHVAHSLCCLDREDEEDAERDEGDLGSHTDAEPEHEQRDQRKKGYRSQGVKRELEQVAGPLAVSEGQSSTQPRDAAE